MTIEISIPSSEMGQADYNSVLDEEHAERESTVESLFDKLGHDQQEVLLGQFCTNSSLYGRETFLHVDCVSEVIFEGEDHGVLYVEFTGDIFAGCKDLRGAPEHIEKVDFNIDHEKRQVVFTTRPPDPMEREPDEI